jgi:O-antigen/teichoic acid export membrane protein
MIKIINTSNTHQAFWVGIGSLFSFGFTIVSSMILSRYFDKGDYGTYKQVIYVYSTLLTIFTLGLPKAFSYYLPRVPLNEAKNLIRKITNLFYLLGVVFSVLLFVFSTLIASFLKNPDLNLAIKIFSPVALFMLPTMGLESILATYRKTQFITIYTISSRIFTLLCVVLPVIIFKGTYIHAIIGFVVASALTFVLAIYFKFMPVRHEVNDKCSISYKEIFKFSLPLLHASLWGMIIGSADQFFISRYFGKEVFADFSNGSLELPFIGMIVGAGSTVLGPLFSKQIYVKADIKKEILPLWISVFEKTAKLIYPLVLFFWFFADIVMVLLYGAQYENSGIYFRIKLIVNFFTMITYAPLVLAIGATKFYAKVHMYGAIVLISLEYISILTLNSPYMITIVSVLCQIGRIIVLLIFLSKYFNVKLLDLFPLKLISKIVLPSIFLLITIRYSFINLIQIEGVTLLLLTFAMYITFYLGWCYIAKIDNMAIIKPLISKLKK